MDDSLTWFKRLFTPVDFEIVDGGNHCIVRIWQRSQWASFHLHLTESDLFAVIADLKTHRADLPYTLGSMALRRTADQAFMVPPRSVTNLRRALTKWFETYARSRLTTPRERS